MLLLRCVCIKPFIIPQPCEMGRPCKSWVSNEDTVAQKNPWKNSLKKIPTVDECCLLSSFLRPLMAVVVNEPCGIRSVRGTGARGTCCSSHFNQKREHTVPLAWAHGTLERQVSRDLAVNILKLPARKLPADICYFARLVSPWLEDRECSTVADISPSLGNEGRHLVCKFWPTFVFLCKQ